MLCLPIREFGSELLYQISAGIVHQTTHDSSLEPLVYHAVERYLGKAPFDIDKYQNLAFILPRKFHVISIFLDLI